MADKKSSPKAITVMAVAGWLGAAISVYRIYTQSQKLHGDLLDAILNTVTLPPLLYSLRFNIENQSRINRIQQIFRPGVSLPLETTPGMSLS
jgi:hypothetical protein